MAEHKIDSFDDDEISLTCSCAQIFVGYSWQDVGGKYDEHLDRVEETER